MVTIAHPALKIRADRKFVIGLIEAEYGVTFELISGDTKPSEIVEARQMYCYLCRILTPLSLHQIGRSINRHHSTVLTSVRTVYNRIQNKDALVYPRFISIINKLRDEI